MRECRPARRLAADGQRVALVCYSRGLPWIGTVVIRRLELLEAHDRPFQKCEGSTSVGGVRDTDKHVGCEAS